MAHGLDHVSVFKRKCDGAYLTEFQVHEMYGTPFEPRNLKDKLIDMDKWNRYESWSEYGINLLTLPWSDAHILDYKLNLMKETSVPINRQNLKQRSGKPISEPTDGKT